jgi:hypothetical protein
MGNPEDFRAIGSAESPSNGYPSLSLLGGREMPKANTGWVCVRNAWVVPVSVIGRFTGSEDVLQLQPGSLDSLRDHFGARCLTWHAELARLSDLEPPRDSYSLTSHAGWLEATGSAALYASSSAGRHTTPRSADFSSRPWRTRDTSETTVQPHIMLPHRKGGA